MVGVRVSQVVVMVGDIRNFSRLSELLIPEELARFLGSWFREVYDIVSESGGVVDKYIGDAFMAYWRVDKKAPSAASRTAITVAMNLLKKVEEMKLSTKEAFNFQIGIGIHEGVVASSNVGGSSQRDSSIMGDAVNTAFRVEATCKELGCPLLLTGEVFDHVSDLFVFTSFGLVLLKGKSEPVTLYGVSPSSS
jgi:adenylate cyclase